MVTRLTEKTSESEAAPKKVKRPRLFRMAYEQPNMAGRYLAAVAAVLSWPSELSEWDYATVRRFTFCCRWWPGNLWLSLALREYVRDELADDEYEDNKKYVADILHRNGDFRAAGGAAMANAIDLFAPLGRLQAREAIKWMMAHFERENGVGA